MARQINFHQYPSVLLVVCALCSFVVFYLLLIYVNKIFAKFGSKVSDHFEMEIWSRAFVCMLHRLPSPKSGTMWMWESISQEISIEISLFFPWVSYLTIKRYGILCSCFCRWKTIIHHLVCHSSMKLSNNIIMRKHIVSSCS